ncbi:MAG: DUF4124 domain-containing protein [Burkholderiales bacterium]|nr:DUF4124 domain-containing protein [Burkholderiales bacterium]
MPSDPSQSSSLKSTLAVLAGVAGTLCAPAWVAAQVYKCADERQQVVYQDAPCPAGRELRNLVVDPPTLSVIPLRPIPGTTSRVATTTEPRPKRTSVATRNALQRTGDPAERRHIRLGMHEGEVMARIGAPDMKSGGGSRRVARWTYMPVAGDAQTLTTVVFDYGKVVEVERKVVK